MAVPDTIGDGRLRSMQITIGALMMGVLTFAGVATYVRAQGVMPPAPDLLILSFIAMGVGGVMLLARMAILSAVTAGMRKRLSAAGDVTTDQLLGLYQTRMIVGAALLEGAAFLMLIAYLVEGQLWTLAGGVVFAGLMAVLGFPTRDGVEEWLSAQREALTQERLVR